MKADPNQTEIYEILADIPKGERNQDSTAIQYSIPCPSFGLSNFTETLCVAKKWWDIIHAIVTVLATRFMCIVPITLRAFRISRQYHTYY